MTMNNLDIIKSRLDYEYERIVKVKAVLSKYLAAYLVLVNQFTKEGDQDQIVEYKAAEDDEGIIRPAKFTKYEDGSTRKEMVLNLDELMYLAGEITLNEPHDWSKL